MFEAQHKQTSARPGRVVGVITAPGNSKGGMGTRTKQIEPTWQLLPVPGSPMISSLVLPVIEPAASGCRRTSYLCVYTNRLEIKTRAK